jgi:general secretion pathway protein D
VTGRISFRIQSRLTRPQLLQAFEAALGANGVAIVRDGETLLLTSRAKAKSSARVQMAEGTAYRPGYQVLAVPLSFAAPSEVAKALEAITGPGVVLNANDKLGLIVLGGSGPQLQSAIESLKVFDQSGLADTKIRWFELSQAPAAEVAGELESLTRSAGISGVRVIPLRRQNGLIIFGSTQRVLDEVAQWVPRLDSPTRDAANSLWVYHPRNTSAEALARTLNSVSGGDSAGGDQGAGSARSGAREMAAPGASGENAAPVAIGANDTAVRAAVDKDTNTLLVSAPAWRWVQLQRVLSEIDRPQAQILIEATVIEVTLRNEFQLGVDWSILTDKGRLSISHVGNAQGVIGATYPGFAVTFLDGDVKAAINALETRTNVQVISAPKIVTLDNHSARLEVGDQVPILTQTSQSTTTAGAPIVSNIDYRNSGVILKVTPRISGENRVTMDVAQEVSTVVPTSTSNINSPTIQERKLESTLVLSDGGLVAIGGLIGRSHNRGGGGVPGLMRLPFVGPLFQSSNNTDDRTELIVLLSTKIIRDDAAAKSANDRLERDLTDIKERGLLHDGR